MTTTQAIGVALILLGVAYGIVWFGRLRRPVDPTPTPAASASPGHRTTDDADAPQEEMAASASPGHRTTDVADATEGEEAVDVTRGVAGRYLGTTSPDGDVAKDLTRAADATLTVADDALAWRPTKGTALRAEAHEVVAVEGLDEGTPLTVRWYPPAAPGTTYETRFLPTTCAGHAALADALRTLRPDLISTADPAPEETA